MFIRRWECSFRGANCGYLFVSGTKKPLLRLETQCQMLCVLVEGVGASLESHAGRAQVR